MTPDLDGGGTAASGGMGATLLHPFLQESGTLTSLTCWREKMAAAAPTFANGANISNFANVAYFSNMACGAQVANIAHGANVTSDSSTPLSSFP